MSQLTHILYVEDNLADFMLLERYLRQQNWSVTIRQVDNNDALTAELLQPWDVVLIDYNVPGMEFAETVKRVKTAMPDAPVILLSGSISESVAVEMLRLGVADFILKDRLLRLPSAIEHALQNTEERRALRAAEQALHDAQQTALETQRQARLAALNLMEDALAARGRAEKAQVDLQQSEQKYRLLAENSAECIFWLDVNGQYQYFSPASQAVFGHPPEAFLQDTSLMMALILPEDRPLYSAHLHCLANPDCKEPSELEFRITRPDGGQAWIGHYCQPMYGEHGEYLGQRGTNRDITVRKQAEAQRDLFSEALRQSVMPVLLADKNTHITYLNPAFTKLFGYHLEELSGQPITCLVPEQGGMHDSQQVMLAELRAQGGWSGEVERLSKTGELIPVFINLGGILDTQGVLVGFVGSYLDLRPLHEKELMLRKLSLAVEQSPESIVITDLQARIEYVNEAFVRVSGYRREELLGQNPRVLHSGKTPPQAYEQLWATLLRGETWQGEFYNRRKNGEEYVEHATISSIRRADGEITHYVAVKEDITARKRTEAELHRLAFYDPLTGLPNRAMLLERLAQSMSHVHDGWQGALIAFNLDRFKTINDAAGQALGDRVLQVLGERLNHLTLKKDRLVARIAGDEFCVLLPQLAADKSNAAHDVLHLSEQIQNSLGTAFSFGEVHFSLSACLGVTLFPDSAQDTPLDVLRRANTALHYSKHKGTGQTTFFDQTLDELAKQRFTVERELHQAIATGDLRLYLQSQVDADGQILGAETLVRWQHPQRGLVAPVEFIPIAEESNLIVEISTWVFDEVCQLLTQPPLKDRPLRLAVNISPRHFRQVNFVAYITETLVRTGANPQQLTLEITEGIVLENVEDVIAKMRELSALGIHFSMDDFGTGYSSLSYLKRLPINELKIDKSFVQDATTDQNDAALIEVILSVARHMKLTVVAEGVETAEQAAFLNQRGTVIHQGYLFSKPEPAATWLEKLPPVG